MSTQPLDKKLRKQLENTIIKARNVAEAAARTALVRLCVGDSKPGVHLTEACANNGINCGLMVVTNRIR